MNAVAIVLGSITIFLFVLHAFMYAHDKDVYHPRLSADLIAANLTATSSSLATALLFLLFQTPVYGILIFLIIIMFMGGQYVFVEVTKTVEDRSPAASGSIYRIIRSKTNSTSIASTANVINVFTYIVLLLIEIILGASILGYAFPEYADSKQVIVGFIAAGVCIYVAIGGFELIASSDRWQYWFVVCGVVICLFLFVFLGTQSSKPFEPLSILFGVPESTPLILVTFVLNVVVVNLLLPLCQSSSWQRFTSSEDIDAFRKGYATSIFKQLIWAWLAFVLVSAYFYHFQGGQLAGPIQLFEFIDSQGVIGSHFVGPLLFGGLIAAIVSTADSLVIALALGIEDFHLARRSAETASLPLSEGSAVLSDKGARKRLAVSALAIFVTIQIAYFGFSTLAESERAVIVGLMFTGVGQTTLLAPIILLGVYREKLGISVISSPVVIISLILGFFTLWTMSIFGIYQGNIVFNQTAPLVALFVIFVTMIFGYRRVGATKKLEG